MLKIKRELSQQDFKIVNLHFVKSELFCHTLEIVNSASETQFQASENFNQITWRLKGEYI